jgi:hypothetical protein
MEGTASILKYIKVIPLLAALDKCHQVSHPHILKRRAALGIHEASYLFYNGFRKYAMCVIILSNEKYGKVIGYMSKSFFFANILSCLIQGKFLHTKMKNAWDLLLFLSDVFHGL